MLAPKLVLTPLLVGSTSLAGRRWGAALSGWLVALPLTSGPIALFIALEVGPTVARQAADGSLTGAIAQVAFGVAYAITSRRAGWRPSLAVAALAFIVIGFALPALPALVTYAVLLIVVVASLALLRGRRSRPVDSLPPPRWDIPARVVVATLLVVGISSLAPLVGGRLSGILATFPVYVSVLATFAHLTRGSDEAVEVLRGLVVGLVGFGAFFVALGWGLGAVGMGEAFLVALAIGLVVQGATWPLLARTARHRREPAAA
jgi:hypothetical protein